MTDETDIDETDDAAEKVSNGPVAGERLAAARREQQISIDDVAKELHLDEPKVRSLERNEFKALGAPVFAKGHLRKYAQLVGISMDEAIAEYESLNKSGDEPPVVAERRRLPREISPGPWIAAVLLLIIAGLAYWWFVLRVPPAPEPPAATAPAVETAEAPVVEDAGAPETTDDAPRVDIEVPAAEVDDAPAAATQVTELLPGQTLLSLSFRGECWTEVEDATGQRLFFELGREGESVNLAGQAPFTVVFGNAGFVDVEIDGIPFDIPAAALTGRTARLSIVAR